LELRRFLQARLARALLAATVAGGGVLWSAPPAHAVASITCPQALLSFQWGAGEGIGTSHPITMSLSQCTTGFRTSALSYGTGTITTTTGTSVFQNNNEFGHYHVSLSITVPDVALGPATVTRDFDVEAAYLTGFYPLYLVPPFVWHYVLSGPIVQGLVPAGWWTERSTFTYPDGSSLVEASLAL